LALGVVWSIQFLEATNLVRLKFVRQYTLDTALPDHLRGASHTIKKIENGLLQFEELNGGKISGGGQ